MIDIIQTFLKIAFELTLLFVGISFVLNLLQGFIPYQKIEDLMNNSHPILQAAVAVGFAFVTPFCSCSTIPIVVNLLRNKVKFSIVMIFLFASPVLDLTILTLMTYLLGWKVSLFYSLITITLSIMIGFSLSALGFERQLRNVVVENMPSRQDKNLNFRLAGKETWELMKTVYPFLILGAAIGALIYGAVPTTWITSYMGEEHWWLVPIAAIIGLPLYIRLSTMIPISQIMVAKGMALGPVMALMISSAGASLPEVTMLHSIFKKKLVIAFVGSVVFMSSVSGFLFYLI
ncbi:hypothetical protein GCM10010954_37140 [Halobacillus andaensis]|uniref:Permease n=1 Tax=Halobacillus andaensis TaxID=1176239 RepID=A0A917BBS0_HALAA|nr:permease [Halobacillus andaensis]MBP2006369.1 uncharacterized membrane protein YraQ (UPF0718 family) [Halobacillus andaensis]GGF34626.1 hypothetical protein GCM10010954_37140 [Halobacillus andaensis]